MLALRAPWSNRRSQTALTITWRTLLCSLDIWEEAELGGGTEKNRHSREGVSMSEQGGGKEERGSFTIVCPPAPGEKERC